MLATILIGFVIGVLAKFLYPGRDKLGFIFTTLLGIVLLFCSFYAPPEGEISPTVMVAFGEICTFAGALMGLDYKWRNRDPK